MIQLKNTVVLLTLLLFGCNQNPDKTIINGNFDNAPDQKIYLSKLTVKAQKKVDSTITDDQGKFTFSRNIEVSDFYMISPENSDQYITLAVHPGDNIHVKANANRLKDSYIVAGSKDSKLIKQLNAKLRKNLSKIDSLGNIYRKNQRNPRLSQLKEQLDSEFRSILQDQREYTISLIHDHPESMASLMALYQRITPRMQVLNPQDHLKQFQYVDSHLYSLYPKSEAVKHLRRMVDQYQQKVGDQIQVGDKVPNIALLNPQGDTVSLSSFRGEYVLLDFWASWCNPCRQENPNLVKNYAEYHDQGFEIFQVSLDRNRKDWLKGIKKDNLGDWTHVSDLNYWNSVVVDLYNIQGIPANYLLNKEGEVIAKNLRGEELDQKLEQVFD